MSRYLLSEAASIKIYSSIGTFANGDTMSIAVYKDGSGTAETLTTGTVTQIGATGLFYWPFSDLATAPTALSEYVWVLSDATTKVESGVVTFGGWVENLELLGAADTCKITVNLTEADGNCGVSVAELLSDNNQNYIELPSGTPVYANSRYFQVGQYKPSYDELNKQAYWVMPQNSVINIKLASFGIDASGKTVPALSTVDLNTIVTS